MDLLHWILLGTTGLGSAVAGWLAVMAAQKGAAIRAHTEMTEELTTQLDQAKEVGTSAASEASSAQAEVLRLTRALEAEGMAQTSISAKLKVMEHQGAVANAEVLALESRLGDATDSLARTAEQLRDARRQLEETTRAHGVTHAALTATVERETARNEELSSFMKQLDVPAAPRRQASTSGRHRAATQHQLNDLKASTDALAAAVVGDRGFALMAAGQEPAVLELARFAAVLGQCSASAAAALDGAVRQATLVGESRGLHWVQLQCGQGLALAGPLQCPTMALRLSAARLSGSLGYSDVTDEGARITPAVSSTWEHDFLADWAMRWKVRAVTLVSATGEAPVTSDTAISGALAAVGQDLRAWWRRAARDGQGIGSTEIHLRSADDHHLAARPVSDDPGGLIAIATSFAAIGDDAMDELCGMVRWNRLGTHALADAPYPTEAAS